MFIPGVKKRRDGNACVGKLSVGFKACLQSLSKATLRSLLCFFFHQLTLKTEKNPCISVHNFSRQLSAFLLCSSGLISALRALSTIYLFTKVSPGPDIILCGWIDLKNQLTNMSGRLDKKDTGLSIFSTFQTVQCSKHFVFRLTHAVLYFHDHWSGPPTRVGFCPDIKFSGGRMSSGPMSGWLLLKISRLVFLKF